MSAYQTISALYVGGPANKVDVSPDGHISLHGAATVFDDIAGQLTGSSLFSTPGTADYDFDESCVVFQPSGNIATDGDCVVISLQVPHSAKSGSPVSLHLHYEQANTNALIFQYQYRVQVNGQPKVTAWSSTVTVNSSTAGTTVFPYTSGTLNQILKLGDIPITAGDISDIVQIRLTRTDATEGNINVNFIDGHVEKDSLGSNTEYQK